MPSQQSKPLIARLRWPHDSSFFLVMISGLLLSSCRKDEAPFSQAQSPKPLPDTSLSVTSIYHDPVNYKKPCAGDVVHDPLLAPSSPGNYKGGTYGSTRNGGKKFHDGMDIAVAPGTTLYSMYGGQITAVRKSFPAGKYAKDSYGNFITISSVIGGKRVYLKYNHLDAVNGTIKVGQKLVQGQEIGVSGTTGNAAAKGVTPHMHLQAKDASGNRIDPENYVRTKFHESTGKSRNPCTT